MVVERKRCFIVSPIGEEGSEVRRHADEVCEFVIRPALEDLGYYIHRGDHRSDPGRITEQMFESILSDDLIIAVLTFQNPNVYYELAVAQAAGRPVVVMAERNTPLPFDIKDLRVSFYDLTIRSYTEQRCINELKAAVSALDNRKEPMPVPFGRDLSPLGARSASIKILSRLSEFTPREKVEAVETAGDRLDLIGIAMKSIFQEPGIKSSLELRLAAGGSIRLLLMHPDNPALSAMLEDERTLAGVKAEIETTVAILSEMKAEYSTLQLNLVRRGLVHHAAMITDELALITPYLHSYYTSSAPTLLTGSENVLHEAAMREFESLWAANQAPAFAVSGGRATDQP